MTHEERQPSAIPLSELASTEAECRSLHRLSRCAQYQPDDRSGHPGASNDRRRAARRLDRRRKRRTTRLHDGHCHSARPVRRLARSLAGRSGSCAANLPIDATGQPAGTRLAMARGPDQMLSTRHPGRKDIVLLVEVPDATLELRPRLIKGSALRPRRHPGLLDRQSGRSRRSRSTPSRRRRSRRPTAAAATIAVDESVPLVLDGHEIARIPVRELLP